MHSSLDALVKNLYDNDFKFLLQEFTDEFSKLVKQKGVYPCEYMDSFIVPYKMSALVKKIICMILMFGSCLK